MLAQQLRALAPYIARYEQQIAQLFDAHPDNPLFNNLPGAGPELGPRLLTAFGTDRERFQSSLEAETYFGIAPVKEQSGKSKKYIHFRSRLSEIPAPVFPRVCRPLHPLL
jgi:transposase